MHLEFRLTANPLYAITRVLMFSNDRKIISTRRLESERDYSFKKLQGNAVRSTA